MRLVLTNLLAATWVLSAVTFPFMAGCQPAASVIAAQEELQQTADENQQLRQQVEDLTTRLAEANQIMDELQRDLNQCRNESSALIKQRDALQTDVQRLNSVLQKTTQQVSEAGSQGRGIQAQLQQLIDTMKQLQQQLQNDHTNGQPVQSDE